MRRLTVLINPKLLVISSLVVLLLLSGVVLYFKPTTAPPRVLPTYFAYTQEEIASLRGLRSRQRITTADLYKWDERAFDLVRRHTLVSGFDANTSKIYAYLLVAQRDAAYLSFNLRGEFAGTISAISRDALCIFFQEDCATITPGEDPDAYSRALAQIVLGKLKARIAEDDRRATPYERKRGNQFWNGPDPMIGIADGSRKTWLIQSGSQFRVPPPPYGAAEIQDQLTKVKDALSSIDDEQRKTVVFWAGGPGTKTPPGLWLDIAGDYMRERNVPLEEALLVRSTLAMGMADAIIAVFDSKYAYWVKRPFMLESSIRTVMPTPNHPSYPAGHSTISAAAAAILGHFFPEGSPTWQKLAREAGLSRVWGGIHFPMDDDQGHRLGESVAREGIRRLQR